MSPDMLMQPFEQSFTINPMSSEDAYYNMKQQQQQQQDNYLLDTNGGYNPYPESNDFRPTFYNPFEIKHRRRTSRAQLKVLEKSFLENAKPNATIRRILAQQLDMTPRGVQIWFQNRRAKAKLQRRKSGLADHEDSNNDDYHHFNSLDNYNDESPVLFSQFFVNNQQQQQQNHGCLIQNNGTTIKSEWEHEHKNSNTTDVCCVFPDLLFNEQQQEETALKMDDWLKMPIHPLAPVIDQGSNDFQLDLSNSGMSSDEWRSKSCPALGTKPFGTPSNEFDMNLSWTGYNNNNILRRMTEPADVLQKRFSQVYSIKSEASKEESGTQMIGFNNRAWSLHSPLSSQSPGIEHYYQMNNCSPTSQQMTPMLSTGSPVSLDGYYDNSTSSSSSCLDLIMSSSTSLV